jgi:protein-tyrosine-phosphatase/predicted ATP-grasp superfamily ATP-dependent carboligase
VSAPRGKVLVLGRDERAFLAVVRSLGRAGLVVHVAWCPPDAVALRSRWVEAVHDLPRYAPDDDAWKHALVSLLRDERYDLVVPCSDPTLIPLQLHRDELSAHARLYTLSDRAYAVAFDKRASHELAASVGVAVPRERTFTAPVDVEAVRAEFGLPVVLKPRASFEARDLGRKLLVRTIAEPEALGRALHGLAPGTDVLVQEVVPGIGVGVELLAERGKCLAVFQHARVHEPRRGGGSSYRVSEAPTPALVDAASRLMAALEWTGVAMVEFRVDRTRDTWAFLEINGRFWGSLPLAVAAGADFPCWLYELLVEGRREFPSAYRVGLHARNLVRDTTWVRENLAAPPAERVPLARVAAEAGRALVGRERWDTLTFDDPAPGLVELGRLAGRVATRIAARASAVLANLPLARRARAARARQALADAEHVLFVCKGNICRSPFAEAYARRTLPEKTVASSGYFPRPDRSAPPEAVEAAREVGVDLGPHRSTVLSSDALDAADAVFVFDEENHRRVRTDHPASRPKLHRLGDLAPNGERDIVDPYGRPLEDFRRTYRTIIRLLDGFSGSVR